MRLTCIIALSLALSAAPVVGVAEDGPDTGPAWAPGAERRFEKTLDRLKLEQTEWPGEYRLVGDGRHPVDRLRRLVITRDGTLWMMRNERPDRVFRAGRRSGWSGGVRGARDMFSTPSGEAVLVRGDRFALLDDGRWRWSEPWPESALGGGYDLEVMDDGTAWVPHWERLGRLDGSTWNSWSIDDLGITFTLPFGEGVITGFGVAPDGTAWAGLSDRDARPAGLTRFAGGEWTEVTPFAGDERIAVTDLDVGADGTIWAVIVPDHDLSRAHLAHWDGERWAAWRLPSLLKDKHGRLPFGLQAAPDGRAWMLVWEEDPVVVQRLDATRLLFDGETWETLDIRTGQMDPSLSFAPDGTAWQARGGAGYMIVPSELKRMEVEAAQPY
ncbi:MAG: hypothetical protein AB1Z67_09690, partial [Candidatus Limnocylindrales bacterium]